MTEEQKIQELLRPRYKVIADWPARQFFIGSIITVFDPIPDGRIRLSIKFEERFPTWHLWNPEHNNNLSDYPHLFRKLEWWEERDASEIPEYVKPKNPEEYRKQFGEVVLQVDKRTSGLHQFHATNLFQLASMRWSEWLPATESEYTAYIEKQPTTQNQGV